MPTIFEVADHILASSPCGLTNRELQKLLYLAQGFYLAQFGEALFQEDFHAWKHGPVNSSVFHKYKQFGYHCIDRPKRDVLTPIGDKTVAFILGLTIAFSAVGQTKLIDYSHVDSPWASRYIPDQNVHLPKEVLAAYFKSFTSFDDYKVAADEKVRFHELIQSRLQYLTGLPEIGDSWISGHATAPTVRSCEAARAFLAGMERQLLSKQSKPAYPKIIMGPIPSGGVSLEFRSVKAVYIHFYNTDLVEIEVEENGHFTDSEVPLDQFEENFEETYRMMSV